VRSGVLKFSPNIFCLSPPSIIFGLFRSMGKLCPPPPALEIHKFVRILTASLSPMPYYIGRPYHRQHTHICTISETVSLKKNPSGYRNYMSHWIYIDTEPDNQLGGLCIRSNTSHECHMLENITCVYCAFFVLSLRSECIIRVIELVCPSAYLISHTTWRIWM
jgi:hypothetical protein